MSVYAGVLYHVRVLYYARVLYYVRYYTMPVL